LTAFADSPSILLDDTRRGQARERLYVFCQAGGWLFVLGLQLVFVFGLSAKNRSHEWLEIVALTVMGIAQGLLLTHLARYFIARWGWKQLGWRQLLPRALAMAAVLSALWVLAGYGYTHGVLGKSWGKVTPSVVLIATWLNGAVLLAGWFCAYFIYHLFDRYNRLEIEQLRLVTYAKEAELRALKSQVNPHFIFNALNSLRALIDENPGRARQAVTQLANLLRYSLQSAQSETVAFEDELRVVNDYLALEQVRHEDRLRVRLDIQPETLGLSVPPLLLQTLVENAVKYGISTRPEGGEIVIIARCTHGQLELRVINPGELPVAGAPRRNSGGGESTGVGLKNARERLRMFFGDAARLQLRADGPSRVVAEVLIPVQTTRA
jgi:LytS/YehU family sensor histidine kinase